MKPSDTNNRNKATAHPKDGLLWVLLLGVGSSVAQFAVEFQWTPTIEREVYSRVTRDRGRTPPPVGFGVPSEKRSPLKSS
jgi:hypothetical protein